MIVRSITAGINWQGEDKSKIEKRIENFFRTSTSFFQKQNIKVKTNRLNLPPFVIKESIDNESIKSVVNWLSNFCNNTGIRWLCVPFSTFYQDMREINNIAFEIAKRYKNAFINFIVTKNGKINRKGIFYASKFIKLVSRLSNNGYDNFRIGTSFNCEPNAPFFPFTYHSGKDGFSIALELVPLFIEAIENNKGKDIEIVRNKIIEKVVPILVNVNKGCIEIEKMTNMKYYGIDASLASFPDNDGNSVAKIVEILGVDDFGSNGTVFFTAFLTDIILALVRKSNIKSIGFNGVMYSLLEDTRLGINNSSKEFSIDSLLSYSTVCGCGIDMVPIPGDVFDEEIASIMLDIASISCKLKKPLGVRMLPIPMKHENEFTEFSYDFLCNTRIKSIKNETCFNRTFDNIKPFNFLINT